MQKKQSIAKQFIKVKYSDFKVSSIETTSDRHAFSCYKELLDTLWSKHQQPIRLLGVGVRFKAAKEHCHQQLPLL